MYQKTLEGLGLTHDGKLYRGIADVYEENRHFFIKWDVGQQVTHEHKLRTVQLEPDDTPLQSSLVTATETSSVAKSIDSSEIQQTAASAVESHALLKEYLQKPSTIQYYLQLDGDDGSQINVMKGTMYYTNPGVMIHNKPLLPTEQKFRIDELLKTTWEGFKEDLNCVGAFVAWHVTNIA